MQAKPTGYVRTIPRRDGPVFYAKLKLPDGTQPQRRLGKVWTKRSSPPDGYLTVGMAQAKLAAMLAGTDPQVNIAPTRVTFRQAVDEWLRYVEHDKERAPSTVRSYRSIVGNYLVSGLGADTPVESITTSDIDGLREELLGRELSRRTVQQALVLLHGVLARAQRKEWIKSNPATNAERVNVTPSGEFNVLTPEQVHAIARGASTGTLTALFVVGAFTGLRCPGELRALRWRHLDFGNRIVHVQRNYVLGAEGVTKGKRVRSVPLADQALVALDTLSKRAHFTGLDDLVFCNEVGEHLTGDHIRSGFYAAVDAAGLGVMRDKDDPIVPYDLRHTFGTLAVRQAPLSDVQAWMGHQHITTTMRYVHYVPQHDAAAKLSAAFGGDSVHPTMHRTPVTRPELSATERAELAV
jgi:integrase